MNDLNVQNITIEDLITRIDNNNVNVKLYSDFELMIAEVWGQEYAANMEL